MNRPPINVFALEGSLSFIPIDSSTALPSSLAWPTLHSVTHDRNPIAFQLDNVRESDRHKKRAMQHYTKSIANIFILYTIAVAFFVVNVYIYRRYKVE